MKKCKTCKQEKDLSEFSTAGKSRKGTVVHSAHCKSCRAASAREERDKRTKRLTCSSCGSLFKHVNKCHRTTEFCNSCYPMYRQACSLFAVTKSRSKTKGIDFDLTMEFILDHLKKGTCPKTGITFTFTNNGNNAGTRKVSTPSIDKIDPRKGYTKDNVQIVCWWYNLSKSTFTDEEVTELCQKVVQQSLLNT